ncbi:hypothetical protein HLV39_14120 [Marinobacter adhaerens]|uniref:Uncharacterized protein n=1 Tax=Marinobacter adhaerens TaxID=1033846 RepID=A0A851HSE8_9GAMM|nr:MULTISPECIES: hypothetical protein [Marinobacter]NWN92629.1 hypothetical protein [Marinobacter adhaerens]
MDVTGWVRRKTESWLDLQGGNWLFGAEFSLMFLSLSLLTTLAAVAFTLEMGINLGRWDWGLPLFVLVGNLLITVPWGLYMHFLGNKAVKESPPVRFNRQRREVAIPRWTEVQAFKLPFWSSNAGFMTYLVLIGTIAFALVPFVNEYSSIERRNTLVLQGVALLGIEIVVISIYLFIVLRLKKKHDPKLIYEIYPWEKLVAFIETQQNVGPSLMATHTFLTLAIPREDDPETALASARINVGHETAGLAQWECIRCFMEEGPDACPEPKQDETLAGYKAKCRQAREEMSLPSWLWKKVGDWFFHRYLAHIITERRIKSLAVRRLPEELKAWSKPLPESQWAKPSETLKALNEQLAQAYERGLKFTRMGPLSQWQADLGGNPLVGKNSKKRGRPKVSF